MNNPLRILALAALASFGATSAQSAQIVVGGGDYTEQLLLAEITSQLLEHEGFEVDKRDGMGSLVIRNAQVNGQIDVYWEYTGTSLVTYNKIDTPMSAEDTYNTVKELDGEVGITWLNPSTANNTYALAVRKANEKTDAIETLSDLAAAYNNDAGLVMAINAEFSGRPDGLPGVEKAYDFKTSRANTRSMDSGLTYQALQNEQVDVALVFSTDGRIKAFDFRLLTDDRAFFPDYATVPVVRTSVLEANPGLEAPLNAMSAKLSNDVMQALNAQIDVDKTPIEEVASTFLNESGLLK